MVWSWGVGLETFIFLRFFSSFQAQSVDFPVCFEGLSSEIVILLRISVGFHISMVLQTPEVSLSIAFCLRRLSQPRSRDAESIISLRLLLGFHISMILAGSGGVPLDKLVLT